MEDDVLRAGGVLEDGEDGGHGAAEVGGVERHGYVHCLVGARVGVLEVNGGAVWGVIEFWSLSEPLSSSGGGAGGGMCGEEDKEEA